MGLLVMYPRRDLAEQAGISEARMTAASGSSCAALVQGQRVVFLNRYYLPDHSATSQILGDLARRLAATGMDVHVICSRQLYDDPAARLDRSATLHGVKIHRVATTRFGRVRLWGRSLDYVSYYVAAALTLVRVVRKETVVVAKTDPPLISVVAAAAVALRGGLLVNWLQDLFPEVAAALAPKALPSWLDATLRGARNWSLKKASCNVAIGQRMRSLLIAAGVAPARVTVIENWGHADSAPPGAVESSRLRKSLGLQQRFVVAYSGNLGRAHDFHTLLGAAMTMREDPQLGFLVSGGGSNYHELRSAVATHKLANVVFLPYQPRAALADSMAAADVHLVTLLPALEGLIVPSKVYGIMAAARPVVFIGDPDGEVSQLLKREQCGFTLQPGDTAGLVAILDRMRQNTAERLSMGQRGYAAFQRQYTADRGAEKWLRVLTDIEQHSVRGRRESAGHQVGRCRS
jgi:glycosyltransferase involved in cell wall biosynthesis